MDAWLVILIVVVAVGAVLGLITLLLLRSWAKRVIAGGGKQLTPISAKKADDFIARKASFAVTTEREFEQPPAKIWQALNSNGLFSVAALVKGAFYPTDDRGVGAQRLFDANLVATAQEVITADEGSRLTVTGTRSSIPFVMKSYAEDYRLTPTASGGTKVAWTIAAHPRLGGLVPLRMFAPIVRPFAKAALRTLGDHA